MKKLSTRLMFVVSLCLSVVIMTGCSFVGNLGSSKSVTIGDSIAASQSVDLNTTPKTRDIDDAFTDAVAKVQRTSVQLINSSGAGSGVIVDLSFNDANGVSWKESSDIIYIVTCHHMISKSSTNGTEGVGEIEIRLADENNSYENADFVFYGYIGSEKPSIYNQGYGTDNTKYAVTLVGGDFESDIALLKLDLSIKAASGRRLDASRIEKAQIPDNTYHVKLGETVFSVGNPTGGLPGSVARGIISCLSRTVGVDEIGSMTLMQIDVSTNPGSSGGGLYNMYGELIGITNAGNTNYTNINFAIPCYLANGNGFAEIIAQLGGTATENNYGYVTGRLVKFGFTIGESTDGDSSYVYIASVSTNGLAYGKLQQGDEVSKVTIKRGGTEIISQNISSQSDFISAMSQIQAGDTVTFRIIRTTYRAWTGRPETETKDVSLVAAAFLFCNTGY